jgi:hypothetical protein
VRRSTDGGTTWSEVDSFRYMTGTQTRMGTMGVDASGQIYVAGYGVNTDGSTHWLVRRGTDPGTWTIADDFQLTAGRDAVATNFGGRDAIYAVGSAADASGSVHWIVRRAALGAISTFATVDDFAPTASMDRLEAQSVYQTASGALFVTGRGGLGTGPGQVLYRRSVNGTSWTSMGSYAYVPGQDSTPAGRIVADPSGNLFSMVRGVDAAGSAHWLVQKLTCN